MVLNIRKGVIIVGVDMAVEPADKESFNVLFVCNENIGRSQTAQAIAEDALKKERTSVKFTIRSAGIGVTTGEPGQAASLEGKTVTEVAPLLTELFSKVVGKEFPPDQYIKPLTQKLFDEADLVVFLLSPAERSMIPSYARDSKKVEFMETTDLSPKNPNREEAMRKLQREVTILVTNLVTETRKSESLMPSTPKSRVA